MTESIQTLQPAYFDAVYAADDDPWRFETSDYERGKYDATVSALPQQRYARALEIGCSIGVLTERLAARCDSLLAVDVSERALERARARCAALPQVRFERMQMPDERPDGRFDLILLSEVGYYWSMPDLQRGARWMLDSLNPGATLELVHWTHRVHDYPLTGDDVHETFAALAAETGAVRHMAGSRSADYRLDVYAAAG